MISLTSQLISNHFLVVIFPSNFICDSAASLQSHIWNLKEICAINPIFVEYKFCEFWVQHVGGDSATNPGLSLVVGDEWEVPNMCWMTPDFTLCVYRGQMQVDMPCGCFHNPMFTVPCLYHSIICRRKKLIIAICISGSNVIPDKHWIVYITKCVCSWK